MSKPLITIIGSTGVGKSKLAVDIAKKFSGEIINGDSMQLFKGLDIVTNKATEIEKKGIAHHLLSYLDIEERNDYCTRNFRNDADNLIKVISKNGNIPILAGGTHYFITGLLFNSVRISDSIRDQSTKSFSQSSFDKKFLDTADSATLYKKLEEIDYQMAAKWHPNDRRKIRRSLEIYAETGKLASEIYTRQQTDPRELPSLRYRTLILWLWAEPSVLNVRLNSRIDDMIELGMIEELEKLHEVYKKLSEKGDTPDLERGIWQVIGYKEFKFWLESEERTLSLYKECLERMQINTRRYAKSQVRWIKQKLVPLVEEVSENAVANKDMNIYIYFLNASDLDQWETKITSNAYEIVEDFLNRQHMIDPKTLDQQAQEMLTSCDARDKMHYIDNWQSFKCDICSFDNKIIKIVGERQWKQHLASRMHRKRSYQVSKT